MTETRQGEVEAIAASDLPSFITDHLETETAWRELDGFAALGMPRSPESARHLRRAGEACGYQVSISRRRQMILAAVRMRPQRRAMPRRYLLHLALFLVTFISVSFFGTIFLGYDPFSDPARVVEGIPFAAALLFILGTHEMAHYIAGRRHGLAVSLPYFIPIPLGIGTFGAMIVVRDRIPDRRALIDLGASGPLAGFLVAVPLYILGLGMPATSPLSGIGGLIFGDSILTGTLRGLLGVGGNHINAVLLASWIGLLITALNLAPIGQLDGGHVAYALWGRATGILARTLFVLMVLFSWMWPGYILFALLLLFVVKLDHPAPTDDYTAPGTGRTLIGYLSLLVFLLTLTPVPLNLGGAM